MMRVAGRAVLAVTAAALLVAGCANNDGLGSVAGTPSPGETSSPGDGTAPPTGGGTPPPTGGGSPTATATASPAAEATRVEVTLVDNRIEMAETSLGAGTYTFVVQQEGERPHALSIEGPGVSETTDAIEPGGPPVELTVTLAPGAYELWCPVGNHREMGMELALEVT